MAKSDFVCNVCKRVAGSDNRGDPTEKYKCAKHGFICRSCVDISGGFLSRTRRYCLKCDGEVLLYE
jgi:hypothetical protein